MEISRNYGMNEWRDDLRTLLRRAGCDGKRIVFLFADSQIRDEGFVEDINLILNTGDVPNLFPSDEKADILEKMMNAARESVRFNSNFNYLVIIYLCGYTISICFLTK